MLLQINKNKNKQQPKKQLVCKKDTGSNVNLMPVNIFKAPFSKTTITALANSKDQNVILHEYNN